MPLWLMNYKELEMAFAIAVAYERATGGSDRDRAMAVFGKEKARLYESLQRRTNNPYDCERSDAAGRKIAEMEDGLEEMQQRRLFGIGEVKVITPEEVREYMTALEQLDYDSPKSLGKSLSIPLIKLGEVANPASITGPERIAFAQVRAGLEYAIEHRWTYESVLSIALAGIGRRYSDPEDRAYMVAPYGRLLTQAGEPWAGACSTRPL